jgi:hypothetical protein
VGSDAGDPNIPEPAGYPRGDGGRRKESMMEHLGETTWVIAEGHLIPEDESVSTDPGLVSHETACLLNTGDQDAHVEITVYFPDAEPIGPYHVTVPARRTLHQRFNDLTDPVEIPRGRDFASVVTSDVPIVVQHTRLDSRKQPLALLSTIAHAAR